MRLFLIGIFITLIIIGGYGAYNYFKPKNSPKDLKKAEIGLFYERLNSNNQNIYAPKDLDKIKPLKSYPKHITTAVSDFYGNNYQIGIEAIETSNYAGTQLNESWEDAYGDLYYFENGKLFRRDKDVYDQQYTKKIPPLQSTYIQILTGPNQRETYNESIKRKLSFKIDTIDIDIEYFGPILEIYRRLKTNEPIFETEKENYYSFVSNKANVVFYIPKDTPLVQSIYVSGENNSSTTYLYHYTKIENIGEYKKFPQ